MIRRRQVYPDANGVVTREALLEAMIDAATFLDFAGGVLSVVTQRQGTGLPGEMVTVGAIIEWRHDARVSPRPEQFEQPSMVDVIRDGERVATALVDTNDAGYPISGTARDVTNFDMGAEAEAREQAGDVSLSDEPDGFDYSALDEEDVEKPVATS